MREILFRGKTQENKWVYWNEYGELVGIGGKKRTRYAYHRTINSISYYHTVQQLKDSNLLIKETVGQFTGLTDKNGEMIFEGDIVEAYDRKLRQVIEWTSWDYPDEFDNVMIGTFMCKDKQGEYFFISKYDKIIGNIHDNPELIK